MTDQTVDSLSGAQVGGQPTPLGWQSKRPARVPLGWLPQEDGELLLASQENTGEPEAQRGRVCEARESVAARDADVDQTGLISDLPAQVADHIARLDVTPPGTRMRAEGWDIAMVDLDRIIAFQPHVFTNDASERVAALDPDDLQSIAELTLPIGGTAPVSVQYDQLKQAYTITSPNPNLKVVGNINGQMPDGTITFGFAVAVASSSVQVAQFQGRYFLRDGYHRAFGLLSRGITHVPAYICKFDTTENLAPAGMLPQATWLGDRPPLLRDYHDDYVAESVLLPTSHRLIVINALELSALN